MKQLDLFPIQVQKEQQNNWILFVDGASRNNPGPAGAGIYLLKNGTLAIKDGYYLGIKTNNQAEYIALAIGLYFVVKRVQKNDSVLIISDSELLVRQLKSIYKVKQPHLKALHALCLKIIHKLKADISHVLRHENVEADKMANRGIDNKAVLPDEFIQLLKDHDITI